MTGDDQYVDEGRGTAEWAGKMAGTISSGPASKLGMVARVIITDSGDFTVWEWKKGEGLVWPTKEALDRALEGCRKKNE